jgi:hypothetical protein
MSKDEERYLFVKKQQWRLSGILLPLLSSYKELAAELLSIRIIKITLGAFYLSASLCWVIEY